MKLVLVTLALLATLAAPAVAATPTTTEYRQGITAGVTNQIAPGPDGNLWFTEANGNIGRISPSGNVDEFPSTIGNPAGMTAGRDGNLWFTQGATSATTKIGRITTSGTVTTFPSNVNVSANLGGITPGPDGKLWFTGGGRIGVIDPLSPTTLPTVYSANITGSPIDIVAGPDGNLWFIEIDGGSGPKIAKITTTGTVTEFALPTNQNPRDIAVGADGRLWVTLESTPSATDPGSIARVDPAAPASMAILSSGITGQPAGIAAGSDGNLWFNEGFESKVGRITPSGTVTEFPSVGGFGAMTTGSDGNLWFTEGTSRIGRITPGLDPMPFTDRARIVVPIAGSATPYPATIGVSSLVGTVTHVSVRVNGTFQPHNSDLEVLLVGPQGQKVLLENGLGGVPAIANAHGEVLTFDDDGVTAPTLVTGFFKPFSVGGTTFAPPAPAAPYATALSAFNGTAPNGDWQLYVNNESGFGGGFITGWSLEVRTTGPPATQIPGQVVQVPVPGPTRTVTGPETTVTVPGPTTTVTAPPDTTSPKITLGAFAAQIPQATFRKGLSVRVTPSEPVTLDVTLAAKTKAVTVAAADDLLLFDRTFSSSGATTLAVKPSAKYLGRPTKPFRVTLRIVATDRAGNRTVTSKTITVAPDKKKRRR